MGKTQQLETSYCSREKHSDTETITRDVRPCACPVLLSAGATSCTLAGMSLGVTSSVDCGGGGGGGGAAGKCCRG